MQKTLSLWASCAEIHGNFMFHQFSVYFIRIFFFSLLAFFPHKWLILKPNQKKRVIVIKQEQRSLVQSNFTAKFLFLQKLLVICPLDVQNYCFTRLDFRIWSRILHPWPFNFSCCFSVPRQSDALKWLPESRG